MHGADKGSAIAMWRNEISSATLHRDGGIAWRRNIKQDVERERWSEQPLAGHNPIAAPVPATMDPPR